MSLELDGLEYFISEKPPYLVLSFVGAMTKAALPVLERCQAELNQKKDVLFVLSLHDVNKIDAVAISPLVKIQKSIRDRKGLVRVCFLKPDIRMLLIEKAAIRDKEISPNLIDALASLRAESMAAKE